MSFSRALFSGANKLSVSLRPLRPFTLEHETSIVYRYIHIYRGSWWKANSVEPDIYVYIYIYRRLHTYQKTSCDKDMWFTRSIQHLGATCSNKNKTCLFSPFKTVGTKACEQIGYFWSTNMDNNDLNTIITNLDTKKTNNHANEVGRPSSVSLVSSNSTIPSFQRKNNKTTCWPFQTKWRAAAMAKEGITATKMECCGGIPRCNHK